MGAKRTDAPDLDPLVSVETSRTASGQRPDVDDEAASLRRALEEEKQRNLRLRADFDNLRKRSAREGLASVQSTHRLLLAAVTEAGAEAIEARGRPFDPRVHDAIAYEPSARHEPGTVMRELRRGWRLGDELIRPAEVVVAAPPPEAR